MKLICEHLSKRVLTAAAGLRLRTVLQEMRPFQSAAESEKVPEVTGSYADIQIK